MNALPHLTAPSCPIDWLRRSLWENAGEAELPKVRPERLAVLEEQILDAYDTLKPLYEQSVSENRLDYLAPGPQTNRAFSQLVECTLEVIPKPRKEQLLEKIPSQMRSELRAICNRGEAAMESYFANQALEALDADPQGRLQEICQRAEAAIPPGLSGLQLQQRRKVERLRQLYSPPEGAEFPYLDNYLKMVEQGESKILQQLLQDEGLGGTPALTFAGCGSMDLTCDLLTVFCPRLRVNQIDFDPQALEVASRLNGYKEALGILQPGQKQFHLGDASSFNYGRRPDDLPTDVLFIAAAIPEAVCRQILQRLNRSPQDGVAGVMMRDSNGLAGHLLYDPLGRQDFNQAGLEIRYQAHPVHDFVNGEIWTGPQPPQNRPPEAPPHEFIWPVSNEIVNSTVGATWRQQPCWIHS